MRLDMTTAKMRSCMWLRIDDPAVIEPILAHLELPGTRDGPQPSFSMTEAGAEQQALPGVTFEAVPGARAAADVCPAVAWRPG
jgi:hypothetical protein